MTDRQAAALKARFLERFRVHGNVSWACREAGITRRTQVYRWQEHDDAFAAAYRQAELEATETLEAEAFRRAVDGTEEPVYQQGQRVGAVRKYSDTLLITLLRARAPEKYAHRYDLQHTGKGGGPIRVQQRLDLARLTDQELAVLERLVEQNPDPADPADA